MKTAYFDCYSGISGDMILGALIDLGLDVNYLKKELGKLNISGYEIRVKKVEKNHIAGTDVEVIVKDIQKHHSLRDIFDIIDNSRLEKEIKKVSKKIFQKLAEAEGKIHNIEIDKVHFHEVGAIDSIIDIVGAVIGFKKLQIENVFCSRLPLGGGFVSCSHGLIPIPSPATVEILKGVPVYSANIKHEMVTPTGAAIITTIARHFGDMPVIQINCVGYGAGKTEMKHPNLLRVFLGELRNDYDFDVITMIETNIDDLSPEIYGYLAEKLFDNSALDVFFTYIQMKKNRPGVKLSVISPMEDIDKLVDIIFTEISTFGVRCYETKRMKLSIEKQKVKTKYGEVTVKIGKHKNQIMSVSPEYEDCKRIAEKHNIPLKKVYELTKKRIVA
jgi:uncharacterized protein (TIGR00299 family) protein